MRQGGRRINEEEVAQCELEEIGMVDTHDIVSETKEETVISCCLIAQGKAE